MKALQQEVERIIEEGEGERDGGRYSVILQAATDEKANERYFRATSDVLQRRTASLTARDLLPTSRDSLEDLHDMARSVPSREHLPDHTKQTLERLAT